MESKDHTADVQAAVNACKEENAYMFGDDEPINNPIDTQEDRLSRRQEVTRKTCPMKSIEHGDAEEVKQKQ